MRRTRLLLTQSGHDPYAASAFGSEKLTGIGRKWKQKVGTMPKEESTQWVTGAPEEIRTPDPQIRRLVNRIDREAEYCKPRRTSAVSNQRLTRKLQTAHIPTGR